MSVMVNASEQECDLQKNGRKPALGSD